MWFSHKFNNRYAVLAIALALGSRCARGEETEAHPVAVIRISESALTRMIDQEINRQSPVDTCFQGTHVVGQALTVGRPKIALHDDDHAAAFQMVFSGTTSSRTTGSHHPVTIYGHSCTQFTATKRVEFQPGHGFRALPASIQSSTQTAVDNIATHRRGLIGRAVLKRAWGQASAMKPAATEFARANAERRIVSTFESVLEERLANLNRSVDLRYIAEDYFHAKLPPVYQCSTKTGYLQLAVSSKPGTPCTVQLPELTAESQPMQLWLHKSLLGADVNIGLALLESAGAETEKHLKPPVDSQNPLNLLPAMEIAPGVKPPPPLPTTKTEKSVTWHMADKDWLVLQIPGERIGQRIDTQRSAKTAATPAAR